MSHSPPGTANNLFNHYLDKDEVETFKYTAYIKRILTQCGRKLAKKYFALSYAYLTRENNQMLEEITGNWGNAVADPIVDENNL